MNVQHSVAYYVTHHPGTTWSKILKYFAQFPEVKEGTVKAAIGKFKKAYPHLYHPNISQTDYNCGYRYNHIKDIVIPPTMSRRDIIPPKTSSYSIVSNSNDDSPNMSKSIDTIDIEHKSNDDVSVSTSVPTHEPNVATPREGMEGDQKQKGRYDIWREGDMTESILPYAEGDNVGASPEISVGKSLSPVINLNRPSSDIAFEEFVEKFGYPRFGGLFKFQYEIFVYIWGKKWSMINLPRDHGKSIFLAFLCEWAMDCRNWDILYLGWTDRRKEIAEFIYAYFVQMNLLETAKVKASSTYHFQLISGVKFDTYLITAKETLGMHALGITLDQAERRLLMIIDDPIDETFREEKHKETKLETKWRSTISNINPDKIIFTGTKKFEEDFFYFIKKTYKNKLTHYYRRTHLCTPFLENLDIFHGDLSHKKPFLKLAPEVQADILEKARAHSCFNPDITYQDLRYNIGMPPAQNLLCPERWTEEELREKREEVGEYWWHSEYEQNPHPITGEVWEDLQYIKSRETWDEYDLGFITIDPATATEAKKSGYTATQKLKATSYTGITIFIRHVPTQEFHVIFDLTDYYEFEEKLWIITEYFEWLKARFLKMKIKVIIETQGGGDDLISSATSRKYTTWHRKRRRINWSAHIIDVHQTRDKIMRIDDYLRVPIKRGRVKFLIGLRNSELIKEIMSFPYCKKFDAIDSLATGVHEAENHIKGMAPDEIREVLDKVRARRLAKYQKNWEINMQKPWLKQQRRRKPRRRVHLG